MNKKYNRLGLRFNQTESESVNLQKDIEQMKDSIKCMTEAMSNINLATTNMINSIQIQLATVNKRLCDITNYNAFLQQKIFVQEQDIIAMKELCEIQQNEILRIKNCHDDQNPDNVRNYNFSIGEDIKSSMTDVTLSNIPHVTIPCYLINNMSFLQIWGSLETTLCIDHTHGILISSPHITITDKSIVVGMITILNNCLNVIYSGSVIKCCDQLKIIISDRPVVPIGIEFGCSIHLSLYIGYA